MLFLKPKYERKAIQSYKEHFGTLPDIDSPNTFCEKLINRIKYKTDTPFFQALADKYAVREYVKEKIGDEYLIPLIDCFDNYQTVLDNLEQYKGTVIKPNHGSGMVYVVPQKLVKSDYQEAKKKFKKWTRRDFAKRHGERHYANIPRKFLVEQFVGSRNMLPVDYKIHLFRDIEGGFNYTLETVSGRGSSQVQSSYFVNNVTTSSIGDYQLSTHEQKKVLEAVELSKQLLGVLEYARVDWYILENNIYFGEITLTPAAGVDEDINNDLNEIMGSFWHMSLIKY